MSEKNTRLPWIDFLRVFAIFGVVLCHCTENIYNFKLDDIAQLSSKSRLFFFASFCLGRLSVPIFLLISGALLFAKQYDAEGIKRFYKNSWLHLAICTIIWIAIYELNNIIYFQVSTTPLQFIEGLFLVREIRMPQGWYMPMILGAYLFVPFIACSFEKYSNRAFVLPLIVLTIYAFCYSPFYITQRIYDPKTNLRLMFTMGTTAFAYLLYMIYGQLVRRGLLKNIETEYIVIISMVSFVFLVWFQLWAYKNNYIYNVWYDNILVLIPSVFIFELCSRIRKIPLYRVIKFLAKYSFPVYLVHYLVLWPILSVTTTLSISKPMAVIILTFSTVILSFIISYIVSKIPKVGNYILYIREIKNNHRMNSWM